MNWYDVHLYDYQMRTTGNEAMNQPNRKKPGYELMPGLIFYVWSRVDIFYAEFELWQLQIEKDERNQKNKKARLCLLVKQA